MKTLIAASLLLLSFQSTMIAQCGANEVEISIEITTDGYGDETSWAFTNQEGEVLLEGGQDGAYQNNTTYSDEICVVDEGCYFFEIWDTFGDGILSPGGYSVFVNDELIATGSNEIGTYASENVHCPAAVCDENQLELKVVVDTDQYGGETYWTITDLEENIILQGGQDGAYGGNTTYADSICVADDGCFFFEIYDTFGDGIFSPGGYTFFINDEPQFSGADDLGSYFGATVHCPAACGMVNDALLATNNHISGQNPFSGEELLEIMDTFFTFPECLASSEEMILLSKSVIEAFDSQEGALFMTPETEYGFERDPAANPGMELQHAMIALEQGVFDEVFTPEVYNEFPEHLHQWLFSSCENFPAYVEPPVDSTESHTTLIRANFAEPDGMNPYFDINADGTNHALRPTGTYLAPGSFATVSVPQELVNQDYYIRVGSHEWDLSNKWIYKRLDRVSKKFQITSTSTVVFNPLGGAISILVPYGADEGNVEVSVTNALEAPFFSIKSFDYTEDFDAELDKPAPWAVFESENVMYSIPKHSIIPGQYDLEQTLMDWETALRGVNSIMGREIIPDKHNMYMISDLIIRGGAYSIGYPMSNTPQDYIDVPGPAYFINGPGPDDEVNFHETGHALAMSKFPGEIEALVNFPYIMAMNYGLGVDLNEAINYSFVPNTFDLDRTATHRMVSNTFGVERDISNTTTDEVRYQHRGYGHYFEIVNLLGWCPLRNFWRQEYIDYQNGIDHGINGQDIDSRIIRMCQAAQTDLRPLFHVFGILSQDPPAVQAALDAAEISPSLEIYNRLQEYLELIPQDNDAFVEYAQSVYPNLYDDGPDANPDYGVGWHFLKSLSYDAAEAAERTTLLEEIIDQYYPNGAPQGNTPDVCCVLNQMDIDFDGNDVTVTGGVAPYDISIESEGEQQVVTVTDYDNCVLTESFVNISTSEQATSFFKVYPNPTSGEVQLEISGIGVPIVIDIRDLQGRLVQSVNISQTNTVFTFTMPESSGVYLLEIRSGGHKVGYTRVVKQ